MPASQYKTISGVKYERDLLELADSSARTMGSIKKAAAEQLWQQAMDGQKVTDTERRTLEYIMATHKIDAAAKSFLCAKLTPQSSSQALSARGTSYYKKIDGVSYDRKLLEEAAECTSGGFLSLKDAVKLWGKANDGAGVTSTEKRTMEYVLRNCEASTEAQSFLGTVLGIDPAIKDAGADTPAIAGGAAGEGSPAAGEGGMRRMWRFLTDTLGVPSALPPPAAARPEAEEAPEAEERGEPAQHGAKMKRLEAPAEQGRARGQEVAAAPRPTLPAKRARSEEDAAAPRPAPSAGKRPRQEEPAPPRGGGGGGGGGDALLDALDPELRRLLASAEEGSAPLSLECPAKKGDVEGAADLARQKAKAQAEAERILGTRRVADVLGGGSREEQQQEFKRIVRLLHPDKGLVSSGDGHAALALRLALAASKKLRQKG